MGIWLYPSIFTGIWFGEIWVIIVFFNMCLTSYAQHGTQTKDPDSIYLFQLHSDFYKT